MAIDIFKDLRAKSEGESLKTHIENALNKVVQLSNAVERVSSQIDFELLRNETKRKNFFKALSKAVILHDFGKIEYIFQRKVFGKDNFDNVGKFLSPIKEVHFQRHEILSALWASLLLDERDPWNEKIITAILFHHYNNYFGTFKEFPDFIYENDEKIIKYFRFVYKNNEFKASYYNLLEQLSSDKDFIKKAIDELREADWERIEKAVETLEMGYETDDLSAFTFYYEVPDTLGINSNEYDTELLEFLLLLGSLRRSDYAASGDVKIEGPLNELPDFERAFEIIKGKLEVEDLWQEKILKDKSPDDLKRTILIAPTGSGKTEFSILWSSKFPQKFLYTLPLRVALNDLYQRFKGIEENDYEEKGYFSREMGFSEDLADLLHSTSFIEYLKEKEEVGRYTDIETKVNSTKLLSSPVLLTTPDQIFLTSLNYYGSDKVIAVYPYSNIVIDEIQTYNPEMAAIIIRTLQLVQAYGGNILVMTATFPPYFKKFLQNFKEIDVSKRSDIEIKNLNRKRHRIKVIEENMFEYKKKEGKDNSGYEIEVTSLDKDWLKNHPRTLIVVNNVKKAISLYKKLKNDNDLSLNVNSKEIKNNELFLLHSRIVEKYKGERIQDIKERLKNKQRVIVVATQIIEASVDFDFDSMITEISSIDSQIQRWGRVHRRRNEEYQGEPNILIFAGKAENGEVKFDQGTTSIYDRDVLVATREILLEKYKENKVLDYEVEKKMVEEVFEKNIEGKTLKEKYEREIEENLAFLNYFTASKKSDAQRIFRKIAGINVLIPELMKEENEENNENEKKWVKKLATHIEEFQELSWKEICRELLEKEELTDKEVNNCKWEVKQKLYEYSVNFPAFYLNKYYKHFKKEFKGFRIFSISQDKIEVLKELGIDGVLENLEENEMEDYFL